MLDREYIEELLCMPYAELIKTCHDLRQASQDSCTRLIKERKLFEGAHNSWQMLLESIHNRLVKANGLKSEQVEKLEKYKNDVASLHNWSRNTVTKLSRQVDKDRNRTKTIETRMDSFGRRLKQIEEALDLRVPWAERLAKQMDEDILNESVLKNNGVQNEVE